MHTEPFRAQLADYILSGHAYLHVPTTEKTRFLEQLKSIADSLSDGGRQIFTWSHATGWQDSDGNASTPPSGVEMDQPDPQKVPQQILDLPEGSLYILKDFGFYLQHKTYNCADVVVAWLCEIRDVLAGSGRTVIFLGPEFEVPPALADDVTTLAFPLPDNEAIAGAIRFIMEGLKFDEDTLPAIVSACRGMTQQQTEDRTALALRRFKTLSSDAAKLILHEKAEIIRRTGLLKYVEPPVGGLSLIGGCDAVKQHIIRDRACFTEEARAFGIPAPRGVMLTGVSGCGKTAISLSAASELGIPLIQFDVGNMMSKWVGESERNTREAIRQVEAMAPCLLQLDEVEKAFGSVGGDGDSGASMRTFGTFLRWMSERICPVYIIMTANDVSKLPPEFTRKGRIDEIFGVFLPTVDERQEILSIHVGLRQREPDLFDMKAIAAATDTYTGADLEQVVIMALKLAFHNGVALDTDHLLRAIPEVRPLSQTDPERVAAMTQWLERHAKPAGSHVGSAASPPPCESPRRREVAA